MNASMYALDSGTLIRILRKKPDPMAVEKFTNAVLSGADIIIPQPVHFERFFLRRCQGTRACLQKISRQIFRGSLQ
jgi:predicted nucleic acid-binding protein